MKKSRTTQKPVQRRLLYHEKRANKAGFLKVAGIDEAGRGPLAGPVVAACVMLKDFKFRNRIDDSKLLTPKARQRAYKEIIQKSVYGIGIINEKIIDSLNIYRATIQAMEVALKAMPEEPDMVLIDGGKMDLNIPHRRIFISKGDRKSFSIACASIIAKVTRDEIMMKFHTAYPCYGFGNHKGYCTKEHVKALLKFGPTPIHRVSFHPVKLLQTIIKN